MGSLRASVSHLLLGILVGVSCLIAFPAPLIASAEDSNQFRYGLENNNQVFFSREDALSGGSFRLAVSGGVPANLELSLVDLYADRSGSKRVLPLGSNEFSPEGLISFKKTGMSYQPSTEFQYFEIPFKFKREFDFSKPVLGGLKISLVTGDTSTTGVNVESSVVGTFSFFPSGYNLEFNPSIRVSDSYLTRTQTDIFPFSLIPDFPALFNGGGLVANYKTENTGDVFLESTSEVVVKGPWWFGWPVEERFSYSGPTTFLVPNQAASEETPIVENLANEQERDPIGIGIYEVTTKVIGALGRDVAVQDSKSNLIIVLPWKPALLTLLLVLVFWRRIIFAVRRTWSVLQNFREFNSQRESEKQNRKGNDVVKLKTQSTELPITQTSSSSKTTVVYPTTSVLPGDLERRNLRHSSPAPTRKSNAKVPTDLLALFYPDLREASMPKVEDRPLLGLEADLKSNESKNLKDDINPQES